MSDPEGSFENYLDDLILAMVERQGGASVVNQDIYEIHHAVRPTAPPTWAQMAPDEMVSLGWVRIPNRTSRSIAQVIGGGVRRAGEIRAMRRPKTWRDHVRGVSRSDWLATIAIVVSIIALFKGGA